MQMQETIINQFKATYPGSTLKQMSEITGINQTRLHRIIKGSEMKLKEFEIFNVAIGKKNVPSRELKEFMQMIKEGLNFLSKQSIEDLRNEFERKIYTLKLTKDFSEEVV